MKGDVKVSLVLVGAVLMSLSVYHLGGWWALAGLIGLALFLVGWHQI